MPDLLNEQWCNTWKTTFRCWVILSFLFTTFPTSLHVGWMDGSDTDNDCIYSITDNFAISEIVSEYKRCVDLIEFSDFTGAQLLQTVGLHFHRLLQKVRKIVEEYNDSRCPNKHGANSCGLMIQSVTHCDTCLKENIICAGGHAENQERNIEVPEDEDLILDCRFVWHTRLEQSRKLKFISVVPVSLPFPHLLELESRDIAEPYVEFKGIQKIDEGMYKCTTILESDVPVSTITYNVKVITGSGRTTEKYKPRPTLPHVLDLTMPQPTPIKDMTPATDMTPEKKSLIIFLAVSCIIIALTVAICVFICIMRIVEWKHQSAQEKDPGQKAESQAPPYHPV
ncbi:uncharacterized protein [Dendrobates tinctorius]|uniref:uncharacterized protein n=1 Tax=Dendrobates tinctorius TaxID=92724 RepID=UPI003CC9E2F8